MSWIDRIKSPILGGTTDPPPKPKQKVDPIYDPDMEFRERVLIHSNSLKGIKKDIHQKHRIGVRSNRRKCFDHYGGSDTPHCVECGETDRRVSFYITLREEKLSPFLG